MVKSRLKLALGLVFFALMLGFALTTVLGLAGVISYFNSGADRASIFQLIPTVPVDLKDRVTWLPDKPTAQRGRVMEPYTRQQIAGAYLHAWTQWNISYELQRPYGLKTYFSPPALDMVGSAITTTVAASWQIRQSNLHHTLALAFYSDDGSIVAFTDHNAHLIQQLLHTDGSLVDVQESTNIYDVVMRLEDGNWRVRDLVRRGAGMAIETVQSVTPMNGFVQVRDNQLVLNEQPYAIAGINYYPQASPWTKFWPEYNPFQTLIDLELIQQLGLNTIRIFVSYEDFGADKIPAEAIVKLTHFLDEADARKLKVIVTIFDHHTDHHVRRWAADDRHLAGLIPPFADHPAILAWDIKNEPNRDYGFNTQALTDAWLRHVARTVRRYDPHHLITIGWSTPEAAAELIDIVDFVSFHYFEELADYSTRLQKLLVAANGKPVVLQEFVMSTWNSFWPHGHTEAEQAYYYANLLGQHHNVQTAGYMVWTLRDFDSVPLSEFRMPWQRATQANMGLVRHNGTFKPSAAVITPGADLNLPPLPSWERWTKPFWLLITAISGMLLIGIALFLRYRRH